MTAFTTSPAARPGRAGLPGMPVHHRLLRLAAGLVVSCGARIANANAGDAPLLAPVTNEPVQPPAARPMSPMSHAVTNVATGRQPRADSPHGDGAADSVWLDPAYPVRTLRAPRQHQ